MFGWEFPPHITGGLGTACFGLTKGLVKQPDLALDPQTSLFVLVHGFKTGSFTGRDLARYINAHETDFINARRCINGLDQADHIAGLAKKYL